MILQNISKAMAGLHFELSYYNNNNHWQHAFLAHVDMIRDVVVGIATELHV